MHLHKVPAPAKLNLFLHVVGRRTDGYHCLQTVFRFVDLCDTLDFDLRPDGRLSCQNTLPDLAPENDIILRAARTLQRVTGTKLGAHIHCHKQIPAGGGLGGGSSNAATTLIALNRLWQTGLSRQALQSVALRLGADVPVFVFGQAAFAQGVGEDLHAVRLPPRAYVIVQPVQSVATAAVFSAPHLTRDTPSIKMLGFLDWQAQQESQQAGRLFGRNDLQAVVTAAYPRVNQVGKFLEQLGFAARMTGSGACWFIEFPTLEQARRCQQEITAKIAGLNARDAVVRACWVCQGLQDHPLRTWICSPLGNRQAG